MKATVLFLAAAAIVLPIQLGSIRLSEPTSLSGDHKKKDKDKEEEKDDALLAGDHKKKDKEKEEEKKKEEVFSA